MTRRPPRSVATRVAAFAMTLLSFSPPGVAQSPGSPAPSDREAVLATVQAFFDTMAARDAVGAQRLLMPEGAFHSVRMQDGKWVLRTFTNQSYLKDLPGTKQRVRERIWSPEVRIRGLIATVWAPYDFWRDGRLSHCGVDAFDLVRTDDGWKIGGGTYTVESECEASPLGPLREQAPPSETRGLSEKVLSAIDLGPEIEGMAGRKLRMRLITIEPGGATTIHSHKDRPGTVYVLEGKIIDHRDGAAREYGPGLGWPEDKATTHWIENAGTTPAVEISVDIVRQP